MYIGRMGLEGGWAVTYVSEVIDGGDGDGDYDVPLVPNTLTTINHDIPK